MRGLVGCLFVLLFCTLALAKNFTAVVEFADDNWMCADVSCSQYALFPSSTFPSLSHFHSPHISTKLFSKLDIYLMQFKRKVSIGQSQPNYECAEFVSRSLAAGGFIPNLGPLDSQVFSSSFSLVLPTPCPTSLI
jgi:hypothetical protein